MDQEPLVLVDARDLEIQAIIDKVDNAAPLNKAELELLRMIKAQDPDCLVYKSHARAGGENYLFYEKGFNKAFRCLVWVSGSGVVVLVG